MSTDRIKQIKNALRSKQGADEIWNVKIMGDDDLELSLDGVKVANKDLHPRLREYLYIDCAGGVDPESIKEIREAAENDEDDFQNKVFDESGKLISFDTDFYIMSSFNVKTISPLKYKISRTGFPEVVFSFSLFATPPYIRSCPLVALFGTGAVSVPNILIAKTRVCDDLFKVTYIPRNLKITTQYAIPGGGGGFWLAGETLEAVEQFRTRLHVRNFVDFADSL